MSKLFHALRWAKVLSFLGGMIAAYHLLGWPGPLLLYFWIEWQPLAL